MRIMKKKIIILLALFITTLGVKAQFVVEMKDGTTVDWNHNANFVQNGSNDVWSLSNTSVYNSSLDVSLIKSISVSSLSNRLSSYTAPTYGDDYTSIASWDNRSNWNLANVHDPSVMRADDGYFYMYQTDASYGNAHTGHGHFFCRRSKNLVDWEFLGSTMPGLPSWVQTKLNEIRTAMGLTASTANFSDETQFGFWAPCVRRVKSGLYRMYYVITIPGNINGTSSWPERAFIGLMETSNPADVNSWVDKGYVITNYSDKNLNFNVTGYANCYFKYNAIDPSYVITPNGEHWLIYGSWHSGFAAVQLNSETGKPLNELGNPWGSANEANYGKFINTRKMGNRWQASEAPEVVYHDGYYYLFMAYDELSVAYNTRVVRSKNIDGPYVGMNGTDVTNTGGEAYPIVTHPYKFGDDHGWVGISHCAVFDDGNGNWYYASQQRFPKDYNGNAYSNAIMLGGVRRIIWTQEGWPVVLPERYGAVPQAAITDDEIVGTWENVNLTYSYGKQLTSTDISFNSDHTVSGGSAPFNGSTWSFDASNNIVTIGSTYKLYVSREVDWESSSRVPTLVFAGLPNASSSIPVTYWGKKVSSEALKTTVVGAKDCTSAFWTVFSDYYTIPANKTLHLKFVNHNLGTDSNWDNWLVALTTDAERSATGYSEYLVLRSDAYGWQGTKNTTDTSWFTSFANNFNWTTFVSDMNGATVDMTITRSGSQATVDAEVTTAAGTSYYEKLVMNCGDGTQNIRAFLTCEKSYLEIDNTQTTIK